jgi:Carboxypeptidase regulatory-like domain/TonB dependent receptor
MTRTISVIAAGLLVSMLFSADAAAQATAQISGSITDGSGAVLPGVTVTVTQAETGIARTTVTNEVGAYVLPNLAIGPYRLEASLSGFRTYAQTGIVLQVNSSPAINVVLQLGELAETVQVEAGAPLVETREVGVRQVVENERILELPLNGRSVTDLITLAGGAVQTGTARFNTGGSNQPLVSVGGSVGFGTGYTLDNGSHVNYINGGAMPVPFPDAVQEFVVETSGLSAASGRGSAVSMVTKSGTNIFHGSAFEFLRDDAFNARQYFAQSPSTLKRNQFGGTLGGPVATNRLFFFGAYQGTLLRQDPASSRAVVPTAAMLAGDWTAYAACTGVSLNRGGFVNNRIEPSRYAAPALEILRRINLTPDNPCGEVTYRTRTTSDEHQYVGRVDYQMTDNHSLFGRFVINAYNQPNGEEANPNESVLAHSANGYDNVYGSYGFGSTYVLSATAVNQFRVSVNKISSDLTAPTGFNQCDLGITMTCLTTQSYWDVGGAFTLGTRLPESNFWKATTWSVSDDLTVIRGNHQWSFGFQAMQGRQGELGHFFGVGWQQFRGFASGSPMADFLTGQVSLFYMAGTIEQDPQQTTIGVYGTDSWSLSPRVTLNYGLRWDPGLPQVMRNERIYSFDYERFQQGIRSTVYPNAPPGLYYPGDSGFIGKAGAETQWWRFAPRVGLAWDVSGDGQTSVRTSYGRSYEVIAGLFKEDYVAAAPWGNLTIIPSVPMTAPWSTTPGGDPFVNATVSSLNGPVAVSTQAVFNNGGNYLAHPTDVRMPSTDTWNVSFQRQFGQNWMASASYLGTYTSNIWAQEIINPAVYIPGVGNASGQCFLSGAAVPVTVAPGTACSTTANTEARRKLRLERPQDATFGALSMVDTEANQNYNGLILTLQRRATNVALAGNYTLSRCIGDYADINSAGPDTTETNTKPGDVHFDRGYCNSDRRHFVNATAVLTTPQFDGAAARTLASNWSLALIYRITSGAPLNVITGQDNALVGTTNQRPNLIEGRSPYKDRSGDPGSTYLDRTAFENPAPGTFGNLKRNDIRGLGTWSFDLALSRTFPLTQGQRIEVRAEAYNVTNSFRAAAPATLLPGGGGASGVANFQTLTSGTFGVVRDALDPRILQFALKYVF